MDFIWKDYFVLSYPTASGVAKSAAIIGAFTLLPTAADYVYNNISAPFVIGFTIINVLAFGHNFNQYSTPYMVFASSLYGLGNYGVYKIINTAVAYIAEKSEINIDEYYNSAISSAITLGVMTMTPLPIKEVSKTYIDLTVIKLKDIFEEDLLYYDDLIGDIEPPD